MKTLVFTAKKLLDILSELERIEDGEVFRGYMFKIIHCEVMKLSYLNVRSHGDENSVGNNIWIQDLAIAGQHAQTKILSFCGSLDDSGKTIHPLLREIKSIHRKLDKIDEQRQRLSYWKLSDYRQRYILYKRRKALLQQKFSFVEIGSLFLLMYKQRNLGTIVDFKYELMHYTRNLLKSPIVEVNPVWKIKSKLKKTLQQRTN